MCLMSAGFWEIEEWDGGGLFGFFPSIYVSGKGNTVSVATDLYMPESEKKSWSSLVAHGQFLLPGPLQPLSCLIILYL